MSRIKFNPILPQKSFDLDSLLTKQDKTSSSLALFQFVLEKFPEIDPSSVRLKYKNIKTSMACRPILSSLCSKKRLYEVIINNKKIHDGIYFNPIPLQAKIGLIAHELAHILDYQRKSNFQLLKTAMLYLFRKQATYENFIDYLTIKKGFGWQLWQWADYVFNHSEASKEYLSFKRKNYLTPKKITQLMKEIKAYES